MAGIGNVSKIDRFRVSTNFTYLPTFYLLSSIKFTYLPNFVVGLTVGTVFSGTLHVINSVIGAGVLALPASVKYLGWVAGVLCIIIFYLISLMSAKMLASVYCINGVEHARYHHAVRHLLSRNEAIAVSFFQLLNIFLTTMAYTITGATSGVQIAQSICELTGQDVNSSQCFSSSSGGLWKLALMFGGVQLFLSQVRNLEEAWLVSFIGTSGSILYSSIALILNLTQAGNRAGTVGGITDISTADKIFGIFNSLGSIGFAYNFSLILLEICDTFKQPPNAMTKMKITCNYAITISFFFYLTVAVSGYCAFGNDVSGMILESFTGPAWALILANLAVMAHMLTAVRSSYLHSLILTNSSLNNKNQYHAFPK